MMIGRQKEGKSTLALQLAIDIGGGGLFLNEHRTRSGKVLYVDFENKPEQIQRRVFDIGKDAAEAEGYTFATVPRSHEQLTVRLHKEPESERFLLVDDRIEFLSASSVSIGRNCRVDSIGRKQSRAEYLKAVWRDLSLQQNHLAYSRWTATNIARRNR